MTAPYAECDIDALIAIRDQLPPPPDVADVLIAAGTVRGRVAPEYRVHVDPWTASTATALSANNNRGDS